MAKHNGTIHKIIITNRRRPWKHGPNAHWTALIMTGVLSAPTIISTICARDLYILAATLILTVMVFLFVETALYLTFPPPLTGKGRTPERTETQHGTRDHNQ